MRTRNEWKKFFRNLILNNDSDLFSVDNDPEVVFDDENYEISMPKIFEDDTKFSEPISENMAKFIKMG